MAGFGFLRQMSETFKYNRDLIAKPKREAFDNGIYKLKGNKEFQNDPSLTESQLAELTTKIKDGQRKEVVKHISLLIAIVIGLISIYFGIIPLLNFLFE